MNNIAQNITQLKNKLPNKVSLIAVSKTKPLSNLEEAYLGGQRIFGENKIQEMTKKWEALPKDIEWHMIGHIQTNKVKYMAPYVHLIHAIDRLKLLVEIDKQAKLNNRIINCLLQVKIATEETKFGLTVNQINELLTNEQFLALEHIKIVGLMGMASFTDNPIQIKKEFSFLKEFFDNLKEKKLETKNIKIETLSMGMSGDYPIAIECGSTMIRVGSAIFGQRNYN